MYDVFNDDQISVVSFASHASSSNVSGRSKRSQGQWHEGRKPKAARAEYRSHLQYSIGKHDPRALSFSTKHFEMFDDCQTEAGGFTEEDQMNNIRVFLNDTTRCVFDVCAKARLQPVSKNAIIDDKLRYVRFIYHMLNRPLYEVAKKWIRFLSDKSMHTFLQTPHHSSLVAMVTLAFTASYIAGAESPSSDEVLDAWKLNILPACRAIGEKNSLGCYDYTVIELQSPPLVQLIFNVILSRMLTVDPDGSIKQHLLLLAVVQAAIMNETRHLVEGITPGLLAMANKLHKFDFDAAGARHRRQLMELIGATPGMAPEILNRVDKIEMKHNLINFKSERADSTERDALVRETLELGFELMQRDDASKYADLTRSLMMDVKFVRPAASREYHKRKPVVRRMPKIEDFHEISLSMTTSWVVFLQTMYQSCEDDEHTHRFFTEFGTLLSCEPHVQKKVMKKFVKNLLNSQRTILRVFDSALLANARAQKSAAALLGLVMPTFDFVHQPV